MFIIQPRRNIPIIEHAPAIGIIGNPLPAVLIFTFLFGCFTGAFCTATDSAGGFFKSKAGTAATVEVVCNIFLSFTDVSACTFSV